MASRCRDVNRDPMTSRSMCRDPARRVPRPHARGTETSRLMCRDINRDPIDLTLDVSTHQTSVPMTSRSMCRHISRDSRDPMLHVRTHQPSGPRPRARCVDTSTVTPGIPRSMSRDIDRVVMATGPAHRGPDLTVRRSLFESFADVVAAALQTRYANVRAGDPGPASISRGRRPGRPPLAWNFVRRPLLTALDCGICLRYLPRPQPSWRIRLGVQDAALSRR